MSKKLTYEFVKEQFEKESYKLLSKKYEGPHKKLEYICPNGHRYHVEWLSWKYHGRRCPYCAGSLLHINKVKASFEKENYLLLVKDFPIIGNRKTTKKLFYRCNVGHINCTTWALWNMGYRCPTCKSINQSVRMSGKSNYQWKGGISFEPYTPEFNGKLKKSILERDDYQCQNPDCWGNSKRLCPHHIDYNKKNCGPSNFVTLCISCNSRANINREYWTKFYQEIMNKKYGYNYG